MNKYLLIIFCLCFSISAVAQTGKRDNARQPKFINDLYMNSHNKTNSTVIVTDKVVQNNNETSNPEVKQIVTTTQPVANPCEEVATAPVVSKAVAAKPSVSNSIISKYAELLGSEIEEIAGNFSLYSFIEDWYGVDYRLGGKDKSGIDCSAFVQKLYGQVFGIDILRTALDQFKNCKITHDLGKAKEGDLVFFHINSRHITHVGIYLANNYFVHASAVNGVVINNLKDKYYQKYLAGVGRLSGK